MVAPVKSCTKTTAIIYQYVMLLMERTTRNLSLPLIEGNRAMTQMTFVWFNQFTHWVITPRGGLHGSGGTWRRCNSLEWNNHSAHPQGVGRGCKAAEAATATLSLRLAPHPHNRTLHPVQLRFLGSTDRKNALNPGIVPKSSSPCGRTPRQMRWRIAKLRYGLATAI